MGKGKLFIGVIAALLVLGGGVAYFGHSAIAAKFSALEVERDRLFAQVRQRLHDQDSLLTSLAASRVAPVQLHAVLRPDGDGRWYIQEDSTHAAFGVDAYLEQGDDHLQIFLCCGAPRGIAGTIQITSDDQFGTTITGHSSLGSGSARIEVLADGKLINPADVWDYLPTKGGGNFWVNITMMPPS